MPEWMWIFIAAVGVILAISCWVWLTRRWIRIKAIVWITAAYFAIPAINFAFDRIGLKFSLDQGTWGAIVAMTAILTLGYLELRYSDHEHSRQIFAIIKDHMRDGDSLDSVARQHGFDLDQLMSVYLKLLGDLRNDKVQ